MSTTFTVDTLLHEHLVLACHRHGILRANGEADLEKFLKHAISAYDVLLERARVEENGELAIYVTARPLSGPEDARLILRSKGERK